MRPGRVYSLLTPLLALKKPWTISENPLQSLKDIFPPLLWFISINKGINTHLLSSYSVLSMMLKVFSHLIVRHTCQARVMFCIIRKEISSPLRLTFPKVIPKKERSRIIPNLRCLILCPGSPPSPQIGKRAGFRWLTDNTGKRIKSHDGNVVSFSILSQTSWLVK